MGSGPRWNEEQLETGPEIVGPIQFVSACLDVDLRAGGVEKGRELDLRLTGLILSCFSFSSCAAS